MALVFGHPHAEGMRPAHAVLLLACVACIVLVQIKVTTPSNSSVRCPQPQQLATSRAPTPPPSSAPPPPPPSPLRSEPDECYTFEHTEMAGGGVVGGGARLKLESARACCEACRAHNRAQPRPRGRLNCTTWVYNHDAAHPQARECWFKRHESPWADVELLANGSRSWTTGLVLTPPPRVAGVAPTSRSCGDGRWRRLAENVAGPLYHHPRVAGVHADEISLCPPVYAHEAHLALAFGPSAYDGGASSVGSGPGARVGAGAGAGAGTGADAGAAAVVRIRLNHGTCPLAAAWLDALLNAGTCANLTRAACAPHCCHMYRAEAVMGKHRLRDALYRAHGYDPVHPPRWGVDYWWGPPYAFVQGRLWHGGPAPWTSTSTALPSEGELPTLHRGTVELVGGGPDFLIALADHPMMPPHNAFGHVVTEDMPLLDALVERRPLVVQNWGAINATVFEMPVPFALRRLSRV